MYEYQLITATQEINDHRVKVTQEYIEAADIGHIKWSIEVSGHLVGAGYSIGGVPHGKVDETWCDEVYRDWRKGR